MRIEVPVPPPPITDWSAMVGQVSAEIKRQFPQVDREDVAQELWLFMALHPDKVEEWSDQGKRGEQSLAKALRRRGRTWAIQEKAAITGYDVEDLYFYSTGLLRELLPEALDREHWGDSGTSSETGKLSPTSRPSEGGNRVAMLCDVRSSLEAGSASDKELLWTTFGLGMPEDEHALVLGITVEALRTRVHRAVTRVQKRLGGPKPDGLYVGTRRVISNSQAIAHTRNQEGSE